MSERLTILGSGVGFPETANNPDLRYPPGYLLEKGGTQILFDCSPGVEFRLTKLGLDYSKIPVIAISHFHPDHFGGLVNYIFFSRVKGIFDGTLPKKFRIVGPETLKERFDLIKKAHWEDGVNPFDGVEVEFRELNGSGSFVDLGNSIRLRAYKVRHETINTKALAFRLEFSDGFVFAYSGDSGICDGLKEAARNADLFLCEASALMGEDKSGYGHLNPEEVGSLAQEIGVRKLVVTHYQLKYPASEVINEVKKTGFKGEVILAQDLQAIPITPDTQGQ